MIIRLIETLEEYEACERLMQEAWGSGPEEVVPTHLLLTIQNEAGLVLGAFSEEGELVGFVMGLLSREQGRLKHHSHMAGVHPDYRDRSIAYRLKLAQRAWCLEQGLELMTWTYDPLEARNAALNIAKLGAMAAIYKRNIYGQRLGPLNADLPTDRFLVHWQLTSPRVVAAIHEERRVAGPLATQILSRVALQNGLPVLLGTEPLPTSGTIGFHIPARIQDIKRLDPAAAMAWRIGTRDFFEPAFAAGYRVVNLTLDDEHPYHLAVYTLSQD